MTAQQREKLQSLQEKYEAMLYVVELIASFHLLDSRNSRAAGKMEEVRSLAIQARSKICR